jgi:rhodanese-related sulfurtransferase
MHAEKVTAARDPWLVTVEGAHEAKNPILWIDARNAERFAAGHIVAAKPLELADWNRQLPDVVSAWRPGTITVVYCDAEGCDASRDVAARLRQELHLPDVYFLEGGWEAWNASNR